MSKTAIRTTKRTANLMLVNRDRILLLRRSELSRKNGGLWGLPGGQRRRRELPYPAACREAIEEMGTLPRYDVGASMLARRGTKRCDVYLGRVKRRATQKWAPSLNHEHDAWRWATPEWCARHVDQLHPVLRLVFTSKLGLRLLLSAMHGEVDERRLTKLVKWARSVHGRPPRRFALAA